MRLLLCLATIALIAVSAKVEDECVLATSCGQCIQKGPSCAWCMDPGSSLTSRCQKKSKMESSNMCNPMNIYQPVAKIEEHGAKIGEMSHHNTTVYMEPGVVSMKLKMGEPMKASFKYKHVRPANDPSAVNVQLQHSELPADLNVKFFIVCRGKRVETKKCDNVEDGAMVDIEVEVTLKKCVQVTGTLSFSVGVVGYRGVSGFYVNPLCGCECEIMRFHEKNSHFCSGNGTLICGQCSCGNGLGGDKCECPLEKYGVTTSRALEDKCREKPGAPICGGNGKCACGKCQCDSHTVSGDFCACDNTSCPVGGKDKRQCSGNGMCLCGKCECEPGFEREDCSCETAKDKCMENGKECGGNGHCECGKCVCNQGWTGAFCAASEGGAKTEKNQPKKIQPASKPSTTKTAVASTKSPTDCGEDNCSINKDILEEDYKTGDCGDNEECPVDIQGAKIVVQDSGEQDAQTSAASAATVAFVLVLARFF